MRTRFATTRICLAPFALAIAICGYTPIAAHAQARTGARVREPIIGGPCEGCEGVFEGLPATLSSVTRIASPQEPGEPLIIDGTVRDRRGSPAAGILVYAYHTDSSGVYRPLDPAPGDAARRHGQLRGWARTDSLGHYRFITIRPGYYPQRDAPQHVHMHVIEPGCCTYYIASIHFDDDPLLSAATRREDEAGRGGSGLTHPVRGADGVWHVRRDIQLGAGVPGYDEARRRRP